MRQRIVRAHVEGDPHERNFEVSALRLEGSQRSVLGVAVTAVDVTERERGLARTRMLDVVRERVGRTLEPP